MRLVTNPDLSAKAHPNEIFHSTNPGFPLVDFVYQGLHQVVHAFQVTIGETHEAANEDIKKLEENVHPNPLKLYFLVPSYMFLKFKTKPAKPVAANQVWIVLIPNPNDVQSKET